MPWVTRRLRGANVWVQCDEAGQLTPGADERVEVLYKKGGKRYRAALRNLEPPDEKAGPAAVISDDEAQPGDTASPATPASASASTPADSKKGTAAAAATIAAGATAGTIHVYTDGACTGNPGPMGVGVVILGWSPPGAGDTGSGTPRHEISEYLGIGTNNIAELTAIQRGLILLPRQGPVQVYSDSSYAIGLLSQNWKAKANQELVAELRRLVGEFPTLRFVKVPGHSGVPENERCDVLARDAITRRTR